jgi:hypothetical protein
LAVFTYIVQICSSISFIDTFFTLQIITFGRKNHERRTLAQEIPGNIGDKHGAEVGLCSLP